METDNYTPRKPRNIAKITHSKYEITEALHTNKDYWKNVFKKIDSRDEDIFEESQKMAKALPRDLYKKVCLTLDMPIINTVHEETETIKGHIPRRLIKEPMLSFRKSLYIDRELDSDTDVEYCESDEEESNIHREFLSKPEREQITWATRYLQPEREDEKSLIKKADDLTDRIAKEFCEYMKELGGSQQSDLFSPKAIKELFQIEFDTHVSRSLRVIMKELPSIEEKVAIVTGNPEKSRYAVLDREITKDIKAEQKPSRTRAFNRSLPLQEQYRPPRNDTRKLWRSARHVPKELVTLKSVWEGITDLRSVREYCRWMIDHPEHRKPPYLNSLGMFDPAVLNAKIESKTRLMTPPLTTENQPAPVEEIRRRLSQLADSSS